ncbi:hypothetical protein D3C85_1505720 [compost metagenome]
MTFSAIMVVIVEVSSIECFLQAVLISVCIECLLVSLRVSVPLGFYEEWLEEQPDIHF